MGLMPQDAYYYLYGQNLSLSYFDHPGMIGYLLRFFTEVFGTSVFVVKFTDFFITSITSTKFLQISLLLSYPKHINWHRALVLIASTIFISILSFNSTPDVPLIVVLDTQLNLSYTRQFSRTKKWFWILRRHCNGVGIPLAKYTCFVITNRFNCICIPAILNETQKTITFPLALG